MTRQRNAGYPSFNLGLLQWFRRPRTPPWRNLGAPPPLWPCPVQLRPRNHQRHPLNPQLPHHQSNPNLQRRRQWCLRLHLQSHPSLLLVRIRPQRAHRRLPDGERGSGASAHDPDLAQFVDAALRLEATQNLGSELRGRPEYHSENSSAFGHPTWRSSDRDWTGAWIAHARLYRGRG